MVTTSASDGSYGFEVTRSGDYQIEWDWSGVPDLSIVKGVPSPVRAGTDRALDSDGTPMMPQVTRAPFTLDLNAGSVVQHRGFAALRAVTFDDMDQGIIPASMNLKLTKSADVTTAAPGDTVIFTLTPSNDGPDSAMPGWTVTDLVPAGMTLGTVTQTGYDCTDATCVAQDELAAGATGPTITITATIDADATGTLRNVAYVAPADGDIAETVPLVIPTNETDTTGDETDNDAQAIVTVNGPTTTSTTTTSTVPGSTSTVPGSTSTVPGSTSTVPGSTTTTGGTTASTAPSQVDPGSTGQGGSSSGQGGSPSGQSRSSGSGSTGSGSAGARTEPLPATGARGVKPLVSLGLTLVAVGTLVAATRRRRVQG